MTSCGSFICYDENAYCCLDDDGNENCCVSYYYYQTWWFWFIWGLFILVLTACTIGCYRSCRRRRQTYVVLRQPNQPVVYGSVVVSANNQYTNGVVPAASAPVQPPPYGAYVQNKPPPYSANVP